MPGYRYIKVKKEDDFETTYENYELNRKSRRHLELFLAILLNIFVVVILLALIYKK